MTEGTFVTDNGEVVAPVKKRKERSDKGSKRKPYNTKKKEEV